MSLPAATGSAGYIARVDPQKLFAKVTGLEPGEQVVAGCKAMRPGQIKKQAFAAGVGGGLGAAIAMRGGKEADMADFDLTQMCVGLTEHRVVVAKQTAMTGKAKEIVGGIPIDQIASVTADQGRVMATKILSGTITLKDGNTFAFEVPRVDLKQGQAFFDRLQERLGAAPAD